MEEQVFRQNKRRNTLPFNNTRTLKGPLLFDKDLVTVNNAIVDGWQEIRGEATNFHTLTSCKSVVYLLKGRVHGLAHAHESKCCFFARARCSEHTSNIVS